ncbi:MAG: DUF4255 domain-containing protein [Opitutaceae bacterium]
MANLAAIRSVGSSLSSFLNNAYRIATFPTNVVKPACTFTVVSSSQIHEEQDPANAGVQVLMLLYRVSIDPHTRNAGRINTPDMRPTPLSIDLHYLLTFWSSSSENEHLAVAWTMRQLHLAPLLDSTTLSAEARWSPDEIVHLIPAELPNEDLIRIWDSLRPDYRLSLAYIARVVRIDPEVIEEAAPVVASRFNYAVPAS